jgi:hypothetical protein
MKSLESFTDFCFFGHGIAGFCVGSGVGNYVMVGIMNIHPYVSQYQLPELFSHAQYKFVGFDDSLVTEVLYYGYKYQSRMRLNGAEQSHVTLVFEKR